MKYPVHVSGRVLEQTLDSVLKLLGGSGHVLFAAMDRITAGTTSHVAAPTSPSEFEKKRNEIARILQSPMMLRGLGIALELFEEVYRDVHAMGGVPGHRPQDLLELLRIDTEQPDETISLSTDMRWVVEWPVRLPADGPETRMSCEWLARPWGTVVPPYIVNYLSSAATARRQKRNDAAVALLSIAAEATLRDVLSSHGYSFTSGATSKDIYAYSHAQVTADVAAGTYIVKFQGSMPLGVSDFITSFAGAPVQIKLKRVPKDRSGTRVDLNIVAPNPLCEHWTSATIATPGVRTVGGLGAALDIARNQVACVTAEDLALDFDEVLQAVRNNLVHLSGVALDTPLPRFDVIKSGFSLRDFLMEDLLVQDFVAAISRFVTVQYVKLRSSGTLYS
ncbi:hypothetical protein [Pseudomonas sp. SO81]|jgi:hypothetical protein|uniref:hypothetical protein n=1 Tax=Pseudomonas sp. SO81 TaxID=2983246 RepID=UPI0025A3C9D8|nr:hypothetical protein [Pseudomonas sp. SO81]WJN58895.1 hypothetical protein OH686_09130 [Pseudomonas sp. SO81]